MNASSGRKQAPAPFPACKSKNRKNFKDCDINFSCSQNKGVIAVGFIQWLFKNIYDLVFFLLHFLWLKLYSLIVHISCFQKRSVVYPLSFAPSLFAIFHALFCCSSPNSSHRRLRRGGGGARGPHAPNYCFKLMIFEKLGSIIRGQTLEDK